MEGKGRGLIVSFFIEWNKILDCVQNRIRMLVRSWKIQT